MKALRLLAENISALLKARGHSQHDLAQWCRHTDVWLSAILSQKREIQLEDLDRVADYFGLVTYQLFQPGIARSTERRVSERRTNKERRIAQNSRAMLELRAELDSLGPAGKGARHGAPASPLAAELRRLTADHERRISQLLSQAQSGGQAAAPRLRIARPRKGGGNAGGSDAPAG